MMLCKVTFLCGILFVSLQTGNSRLTTNENYDTVPKDTGSRNKRILYATPCECDKNGYGFCIKNETTKDVECRCKPGYGVYHKTGLLATLQCKECKCGRLNQPDSRGRKFSCTIDPGITSYTDTIKCKCDASGYVDTGKTCAECNCGRLIQQDGQGQKFNCTFKAGSLFTSSKIICNCDVGGYYDTGKSCNACGCGEKYDGMLFNCSSSGKCQCPKGYKSVKSKCEPDNVCQLSPCKNGGSCENNKTGLGFVCKCTGGFGGNLCEIIGKDPCEKNPCKNGGTCNKIDYKTVSCSCPEEYTGAKCEKEKDPCEKKLCKNGGTCKKITYKKVSCSCPEQYTGLTCEKEVNPCDPNPCRNGGTCNKQNYKNFTCTCPETHNGTKCEKEINPCDSNPCKNGGTCEKHTYKNFTCVCPKTHNGTMCEKEINPCDANPCKNGGTCKKRSPKDFTCICPQTHNGTTCENEINPCDANPCKNGGTCKKRTYKDFECVCPVTHNGTTCENEINPCDANPCKNGGTCKKRSPKDFTCICPQTHNGTTCEKEINPCDANPCKNDGICKKRTYKDFECVCPVTHNGTTCENEINPCDANPCKNGGTCNKRTHKDFTCVCPATHNGTTCENEILFSSTETPPSSSQPTTATTIKIQSTATPTIPPTAPITTGVQETTSKTTTLPPTTLLPTTSIQSSTITTVEKVNTTSPETEPPTIATKGIFSTTLNETEPPVTITSTKPTTTSKVKETTTTTLTVTEPIGTTTTKKETLPTTTTTAINEHTTMTNETKETFTTLSPTPSVSNVTTNDDWCVNGPGKALCKDAKCSYDSQKQVGLCKCPENQFFDYSVSRCTEFDRCPIMNLKCKDPHEVCVNSKCQCHSSFKYEGSKCIPNLCSRVDECGPNTDCKEDLKNIGNVMCLCKTGYYFNGTQCVKVDICSHPGYHNCSQICINSTQSCSCEQGFTLTEDNKTCKGDPKNLCKKNNCGKGTCYLKNGKETCICPPTHVLVKGTCVDKCTAGKLPPGLCPGNLCVTDKNFGFKCNCSGKYKLSNDGVTCERKRMCIEGGKTKICGAQNATCAEDNNNEGYRCVCKTGQEMNKGICQNKCELVKYQDECAKKLATCEMTLEANTGYKCKCPPALTTGKDGKCNKLADHSYMTWFPLSKKAYTISAFSDKNIPEPEQKGTLHSFNAPSTKADIGKIETHIRESVQHFYAKQNKGTNVIDCKEAGKFFNCALELQFNTNPGNQINLILAPENCIPSKVDPEICVIPPQLILHKSLIEPFRVTDPCYESIKSKVCGEYTSCTNGKDKTFTCACEQGYTSLKSDLLQANSEIKIMHKCERVAHSESKVPVEIIGSVLGIILLAAVVLSIFKFRRSKKTNDQSTGFFTDGTEMKTRKISKFFKRLSFKRDGPKLSDE